MNQLLFNKYYQYIFSFIFVGFIFLSIPVNLIYAQEKSTRNYDCSWTGRCSNQVEQEEALYIENLSPGVTQTQTWELENNSQNSCRVYLRLKLLDDPKDLSEHILITATGKLKNKEQKIINTMQFSKLLKRQSIYLGNLPANSTGTIDWKILLDELVGNEYQAASENFNTLLYSYCLTDKKQQGDVKGVTTESSNKEKYLYAFLSIFSFSILLYSHFKTKNK